MFEVVLSKSNKNKVRTQFHNIIAIFYVKIFSAIINLRRFLKSIINKTYKKNFLRPE